MSYVLNSSLSEFNIRNSIYNTNVLKHKILRLRTIVTINYAFKDTISVTAY
jgi:hypothetical protein